jgi:CTP synthase
MVFGKRQVKWIIVSGGVLSGLGKGVVTASIGRLLRDNYKIIPVKCDGYLNVDPGTINPYEHGEVFVLEDGGEVDMDFGHYERFLNIDCRFGWNLTSGKIFNSVIQKERQGKYLGQTVQIVPHVINEVKERLHAIAKGEKADVMIIEVGGTVGDIENMIFFEAVRQLRLEVGPKNLMYVHLTYVPELNSVGEQKTKPTQQSTKLLQEAGIQPDVIVGRCDTPLTDKAKHKIALFCNLLPEEVISDPNTRTVYELPLIFEREGLHKIIERKLGIRIRPELTRWKKLVNTILSPKREVRIALCGKYTDLKDSYVSISEALVHAGANLNTKVSTKFVETTEIEQGKLRIEDSLSDVDGVIIPGGFGSRGGEGKIRVIRYLREKNIPFLGLCFGLQLAMAEFARDVCLLKGANSTEIDPKTPHPVIFIMPEQKEITRKGATMRLGSHKAILKPGSLVSRLYNSDIAYERHRHRYEVNPLYHAILRGKGMVFSGMSPDNTLVEFIELPEHRFFVGTQGHPELKSRLERPAPLFYGFVRACLTKKGSE